MNWIFYWSYTKFCAHNIPIARRTEKEYLEAKNRPVIVHFNGPGLVRPWQLWCSHPYRRIYRKKLKQNNQGYKIQQKGDTKRLITQFIKHAIFDRIECFIHK